MCYCFADARTTAAWPADSDSRISTERERYAQCRRRSRRAEICI